MRLAIVLFSLAACGPATITYTLRIETEPQGAKIYDPRTDALVGTAPLEIPLQYSKASGGYLRMQTRLDAYSPQDPSAGTPHLVQLEARDFVKLYVVADAFEKEDAEVSWLLTPVDGQVITKVIRLKPVAGADPSKQDVFR